MQAFDTVSLTAERLDCRLALRHKGVRKGERLAHDHPEQ